MTKRERSKIGLLMLFNAALVIVSLQRPLPAQTPTLAADSSLSAKLVAEASRMIGEFPNTRYSHKTHIDREHGICEVDCSGFVGTILKQVSPEHLAAVRTAHQRPLAEDFYHAFDSQPMGESRGWKQIHHVESANAGDIIAWLKLERKPGDSTGHVMIIAEKPVMVSRSRARVRVFDSTLHGHARDTRPQGKNGIGEGTIWLELDPQGHPVAFHWKSIEIAAHEVPIRIGRPVPIRK